MSERMEQAAATLVENLRAMIAQCERVSTDVRIVVERLPEDERPPFLADLDRLKTLSEELSRQLASVDAVYAMYSDAKAKYGGESLCMTVRGFCAAKGVTDQTQLSREDVAVLNARLGKVFSMLVEDSDEYLRMCGVKNVSELSPVQCSIYNERLQALVHREDRYPFPK